MKLVVALSFLVSMNALASSYSGQAVSDTGELLGISFSFETTLQSSDFSTELTAYTSCQIVIQKGDIPVARSFFPAHVLDLQTNSVFLLEDESQDLIVEVETFSYENVAGSIYSKSLGPLGKFEVHPQTPKTTLQNTIELTDGVSKNIFLFMHLDSSGSFNQLNSQGYLTASTAKELFLREPFSEVWYDWAHGYVFFRTEHFLMRGKVFGEWEKLQIDSTISNVFLGLDPQKTTVFTRVVK